MGGSHDMSATPRCTKTKTNGQPCSHYAITGTDACRYHIGKSVDRVKGDLAAQAAAVKVFGTSVVPVTNPFLALADLAGELMAAKDALRDRVNALTKLTYTAWGKESVKAEVALYQTLLDMTSKVVTDMARLNIEARLAKVDELQARQMLDAFEGTLTELGLTADVRASARVMMARRLAH